MKKLHLRFLFVAITSAFALLAATVAIYYGYAFPPSVTGRLIFAGVAVGLFALSVFLHKTAMTRHGAGCALFQSGMWLGLFLVILPNAMMALVLFSGRGTGGPLVDLATMGVFLFGSPYYAYPAEIFGDKLFLLETIISPLGVGGLLVSVVFYATVVTVMALLLHAISSLLLGRTLGRGERLAGLIGITFAIVILGIYGLWNPEQRDFRVSRPQSAASARLLQATEQGDIEMAKAFLDEGADIQARDEHGWDALYHAVYGEHVELVEFLLEQGADPNTRENRKGNKCLNEDCSRGLIISERPVIERAVYMGNWDVVQLLISHGVIAGSTRQLTPLTIAVGAGDLETLQGLLDVGTNLRADKNALRWAAWLDHSEPLRLLLDAGGDPDHGIHAAAEKARAENLKILLDHGADPNAQTQYGVTPLMSGLAKWQRYDESEVVEAVNVLIAAGANVNYVNDFPLLSPTSVSILMEAVWHGNPQAVQLLVDHGADLNHQDSNGSTALMYAADPAVVRVLLAAGADATIRNNDGLTALENAVQSGQEDLIAAFQEKN